MNIYYYHYGELPIFNEPLEKEADNTILIF